MVQQFGPYRVQGELGRGGMAVTYGAVDVRTGVSVALKVLLQPLGGGEAGRARFEREVGALRRVDHPGVVRVLDAGVHQGRGYVVMERVFGSSLQERLERGSVLSMAETAELGVRLGEAVQAAHAAGVLHRDLKPANVLIRHDGTPTLVDFGLAKSLDPAATRLTRSGTFVGTPGYMAPEQAGLSGAAVGPAVDVYGLGATLYACLARVPPVQGDSFTEVLVRTTEGAITPLRELRSDVDGRLAGLIVQALALLPEDRYGSAKEFVEALRDYLAAGELTSRRSWGWLGWVAACAIAGVGGVAAARWAEGEEVVEGEAVEEGDPLDAVIAAAEVEFSRGDVDAAVERLRAAVQVYPERARVWEQLGVILLESGRLEEAEPAFEQALALDEDYDRAWHGLGAVRLKRGRPQEALQALDRALEYAETSGRYRERASAWVELGNPERALSDFARALELPGEHGKVYNNRGLYRQELGQLQEALSDLDRAVELDPSPEAYNNRAMARAQLGDVAGALEDYAEALSLAPEEPRLWLNRGMERMGQGDLEAGLRDFARAEALAPDWAQVYFQRSRQLARVGRLEEALEDATRAIGCDPDDASFRLWRMQLRRRGEDARGAEADADELLRRDPDNVEARMLRAGCAWDRGDVEAALRDLDVVVRLMPRHPEGFRCRGEVRRQSGDVSGAVEDYTSALERVPETHPGRAGLLLQRARCHQVLGNVRQARADAALAVERGAGAEAQALLEELEAE